MTWVAEVSFIHPFLAASFAETRSYARKYENEVVLLLYAK
jgi:hypothetical protein